MDGGVGGYERKSTLTGEVCRCGTGVRCSTRECEWGGGMCLGVCVSVGVYVGIGC
jgi:hypothetical protein